MPARVPALRQLIADGAYDSRKLRDRLAQRGCCEAVIPPNPTRKNPYAYDRTAYRSRKIIERMFCGLKDVRRIGTGHEKRADTFLSTVLIAATLIWWLN